MKKMILLFIFAILSSCQAENLVNNTGNSLLQNFQNPPKEYRIIQYGEPEPINIDKFKRYGIGGFMAFFHNEMRDPSHQRYAAPAKIGPMINAAHEKGFQVWLADDFGYPSGMAGGMVVEENPDYEVRGLVHLKQDGCGRIPVSFEIPADTERIAVAVMYAMKDGQPDFSSGQVVPVQEKRQVGPVNELRRVETQGLDGDWQLSVFALKIRDRDSQGQQTMAQFQHSGRYPDLMNPDAVSRFIELMHGRIADAAGDGFSSKVRGFYTNEPNLMQLHWNQTNPEGPYAYLPWNGLLPDKFKQMHGYELLPMLGALYECDDVEARRVRMHFHQTVAELLSGSFARQIQKWCAEHGVLSSGHFLLDEYLCLHVACYGDLMKFLSEFDIPAFDVGIANPDHIASFSYQYIKYTSSVAAWKERDEVICLPDPIIAGGGLNRPSPAMPLVRNTVNMAFLHGANQITSYLHLDPKGDGSQGNKGYTPEEYSTLNEYVGRISLLLRGARRETSVALYYPISMFQADYKPSNLFWTRVTLLHKERQRAWQQTEHAILDAGLDYTIVHPEALEQAQVGNGVLKIGYGSYRYLVMPQVEIISKNALDKIKQFEASGGTVLWVDKKPVMGAYLNEDAAVIEGVSGVEIITRSNLPGRITEPYGRDFVLKFGLGEQTVSIARFRKGNQCIYYLVNRSEESIKGKVHTDKSVHAELYDPSTGSAGEMDELKDVQIGALRSLLVMHPAEK